MLIPILRKAFFAALVAAGLFSVMLGFHARQNMDNQLEVVARPALYFFALLTTFTSSFLFFHLRSGSKTRGNLKAFLTVLNDKNVTKFLWRSAIVFLFVFPFLSLLIVGSQGSLKWIDNYGVQILIYVMLGWGLSIVVGLAGLLDLGYVAFYAVGAYSFALLSKTFGLSFWLLLPVSGVMAAFFGIILGFPVLRLRGDYLAVVTLAFGEIIRLVLINWIDFSGGSAGISGIPRPTFFGVPFNASPEGFSAVFGLEFSPVYRTIYFYYIILFLAGLTGYVAYSLRKLPVGRAWEAMREDEIACRSLGINTVAVKLTAFAIGASLGGLAGAFFATRQGYISPASFTFPESAQILAIVVMGGLGSISGIVASSVAIVAGIELLRELDFLKYFFGDSFDPSQYRNLFFGAAMVIVMLMRPRGIVSSRKPTISLKEAKTIASSQVSEGSG